MFVNNLPPVNGIPQSQLEPKKKKAKCESLVQDHFLEELNKLRQLIECDPLFIPFRQLPDSLLTVLYGEKQCLAMTPNTRRIHDENGTIIGGYESHYECPDDAYHPKVMRPFNLEGFWIPISEGHLFSIESPVDALTRTSEEGIQEILFLVHPSSNEIYTPLREKYAINCLQVPALALSSFRTLLIAVPARQGVWNYEMVKVSLDKKIGGVERRLHWKECACSVSTTALLAQRHRTITCFQEDWAFVPKADLIDPKHEIASARGAGMIHRTIPEWLSAPSCNEYVVPLFALFGRKNWPLLKALIKQSLLSPTEFIRSYLLKPFAELLVDHAVKQRTSLELHGQNLLLRIRCPKEGSIEIRFAYRDMRGANTQMGEDEFNKLPKTLQDRSYFYSETYCEDAAWVMESISRRVCFELTKQLFKADDIDVWDPEFARWKQDMIRLGYSCNWTIEGIDNDAHEMEHTLETFFRYGYFSKIFGHSLLEVLSREGIFLDLVEIDPKSDYTYYANLLGDAWNPCLNINWFQNLMLAILNSE